MASVAAIGMILLIFDQSTSPVSFGMKSGVPVSYTHLRAHETVLDLVCRLLLEKKKEHILSRTARSVQL